MLLVDIPEGNSVSQKQKGEFVWIVKRWMRIHPPILVGLNGKIPKCAPRKNNRPYCPLNSGCFIGILISWCIYGNPHITG